MLRIHQRLFPPEDRSQPGHWEYDLILGAGQQSAVATFVERKFRSKIHVAVPGDHSAQSVGDALIGALNKLPAALRRTFWGQGNEMGHHEHMST